MNARALNQLAGVICRAQEQDRTPMGIAIRIESAGMLQSPETAAALAELTVYRASHEDGIVLGHYTTAEAAREHCDDLLRREGTTRSWDWCTDEDDNTVQVFVNHLTDAPEQTTGYVVTPLTVDAEYDPEVDE